MTRAEFEALSEADQRRLRNLDTTGLTDEDYFTKFGMTRAAFEALPEAERRRLLNLDTGEIGKQYEAVDAQGNVLARAFLADKAALDKFVADYPGATIREALTQELGDEVLLYNPNDLNAPPVRERVGTPTYNTSRNAGLRTLEEIDELQKLTTPEAPGTLEERQLAAITDQNTLDNIVDLSPQELSLFAAEVAAYTEPKAGPSGVTPRRGIPINTQEAMRRAHAAGVSFPGIDPSLFGAAPRAQDFEVRGLQLLTRPQICALPRALSLPLGAELTFLESSFQKFWAAPARRLWIRRKAAKRLNLLRKQPTAFTSKGARLRESLKIFKRSLSNPRRIGPTQTLFGLSARNATFWKGISRAFKRCLKTRSGTTTRLFRERESLRFMRSSFLPHTTTLFVLTAPHRAEAAGRCRRFKISITTRHCALNKGEVVWNRKTTRPLPGKKSWSFTDKTYRFPRF